MKTHTLETIMLNLVESGKLSQHASSILLKRNETKTLLTNESGHPTGLLQDFVGLINQSIELVHYDNPTQYQLTNVNHDPNNIYHYTISYGSGKPDIIETTMDRATFSSIYYDVNDNKDITVSNLCETIIDRIQDEGFTAKMHLTEETFTR